jgi:hypothetical protein
LRQIGHARWLEGLVLALAVWIALAAMHPALVFEGKIYASSDMQSAAAFKHLGDLALAAGEYPLWTPYVFAGMPSYASLAYTPDVYPLTKPLRIVTAALALPPMTWLLFHLFVAGISTAAYARWRGLSVPASALAGVLIMSVPNLVAWAAYGHGTKVGTFAWLPLVLLCLEGVLRTGRVAFAFGLAAALSLQLLRGHVQIVYYTGMLVGVWILVFAVGPLRDRLRRPVMLRRLALTAGAGLLALGSAMVLYLPVLDYQGHSIRGASSQGGGAAYEYATNWSLPVSELDTLWWPTAAGYGRASYVGGMPFTDYPNYLGGPILLLAGLGLLLRRDRWTVALAGVAFGATLVGLGRHGPLYPVLYDVLPGFKKFRVPVMILILQEFATILLAAAGLDEAVRALTGKRERPSWLGTPLLALALIVAAGLLLLGTVGGGTLREMSLSTWEKMRPGVPLAVFGPVADLARADAVRLGLVVVLVGAVLVAAARRRLPAQVALAAVAVLLFVDYLAVDQPLLHPEKHLVVPVRDGQRIITVPAQGLVRDESAVTEFVAGNSLTQWLREHGGPRPRVWPLGEWSGTNLFAGQEIVSLGGYQAAKLKIYEEIRSRLYDPEHPRWELANLLAATYVVVPFELTDRGLQTLAAGGVALETPPAFVGPEGAIYRNTTALPRAWLVDAFEVETPGQDRSAQEPDVSVVPDPAPQPGASAGRVEIGPEGTQWVDVDVDSPAAGVLVLADIYYPDWTVEVDGRPARLLRADYALRGVALEAGSHHVEFRFRSSSYRRGKAVSRASGAVIALGLVGSLGVEWLRRRRGKVA